jgi:hypothetical protein
MVLDLDIDDRGRCRVHEATLSGRLQPKDPIRRLFPDHGERALEDQPGRDRERERFHPRASHPMPSLPVGSVHGRQQTVNPPRR